MKKHYLYTILFALLVVKSNANNSLYSWQNLPTARSVSFKKDTFNITDFGAKSSAMQVNTTAIQNAIDACSKNGGGVVLVPSGIWITAPIELKSNVNLNLAANALLQFTANKTLYALTIGEWEGQPSVRNQSPIWATNANDIAITGSGIVDGNGDIWRPVKRTKLTASQWKNKIASGGIISKDGNTWYPSESYVKGAETSHSESVTSTSSLAEYEVYKDYYRPNLIAFNNCDGILLDGVTFQNSAAWNIHLIVSRNITIQKIIVRNPWYAQNGDGIDIESCSNVVLENSVFDVGDDGICIKSGRDEAGRKRGVPTENVLVRNCTVYHAHGGFVIGSEMSGGARNLFVTDCTFSGTDIGLRFKTTRGRGGIVENIYARNIVMKDIVGDAILFDMYYAAKDPILLAGETDEVPKVQTYPVNDATPQFKNFELENIICSGANRAIFVRGLPEMSIKNISIKNAQFTCKQGIELIEAQNVQLTDIVIESSNSNVFGKLNNVSESTFRNIKLNSKFKTSYQISGTRSKNIKITGVDAKKQIANIVLDKEVPQSVLIK